MPRIIHVVLNSATLCWLTWQLVRRTFLKFGLAFQCRGESRPGFVNNAGMREGDRCTLDSSCGDGDGTTAFSARFGGPARGEAGSSRSDKKGEYNEHSL